MVATCPKPVGPTPLFLKLLRRSNHASEGDQGIVTDFSIPDKVPDRLEKPFGETSDKPAQLFEEKRTPLGENASDGIINFAVQWVRRGG
tara:strand:+ start:1106 stop:1372 length:267 start_codon:yes stop_codon:yes gene_type:complete